jgi:hypothetical protein
MPQEDLPYTLQLGEQDAEKLVEHVLSDVSPFASGSPMIGTYLYLYLRSGVFDHERFVKFMEAMPLPRLDLDFRVTGSTRSRPSCVGDHDVSLASCLPGST